MLKTIAKSVRQSGWRLARSADDIFHTHFKKGRILTVTTWVYKMSKYFPNGKIISLASDRYYVKNLK